jgi:2,5-dihydroxypyridine 5,6-dioxygenase
MSANSENSAKLARAAMVLVRDMMCIKSGESVLITADTNSDQRAMTAVQDAAYALGGKVATIVLASPLPFQGGLANPYIPDHVFAAVTNCDAWIDLCMPYLAGSKAYDTAVNNNRTRYFLAADIGAEGILRLFGNADIDKVFAVSDCFGELLAKAAGKECRITSPGGTDVTFALAEPEGLDIAKAVKPGGYFVPGTVMIIPDLPSVRGKIVCETTFHEYYTPLSEPLEFHVDGKITAVTGGGPELAVMDRALRRAGNGEYGNIVHFTCGYHPAARFTGRSFIEDQRVVGCNAVGLGLPQWLPGGGENHPDCVMKGQSIWVDGKQIVKDGVIIGPAALRKTVEALEPIYS